MSGAPVANRLANHFLLEINIKHPMIKPIRDLAIFCAALCPLASLRATTYTNTAYNPSGGTTWNGTAFWSGDPDPVAAGNDYLVNPDPARIANNTPIGTYFTVAVGEASTAWRYFSYVRDFGTGTPTGGDTYTFNGDKLTLADKASFRGFGRNTTSVANWEMQDGGMMVLNAGGPGTTTAWNGSITTSGTTALGLITNNATTLTVNASIAGTGTLNLVQSSGAAANLILAGDISRFTGTLLLSSSTTKNTNTATFSIANSATSATLHLNWESPLFRYDLAENNVTFASLILGADTVLDAGIYTAGALNALTGDIGIFSGTGAITVIPSEPSGYDTWASGFPFTPGVNDGPNDDPDGDGIGNLLEYALGGVPVGAGAGDTSILPDQSLTATDLVLTFHRSDSSETDVTLKVQWSGDMDTWTDFATIGPASSLPEVVVTEDSPAAGLDTVVVTIPRGLAPGGKLFARLQAVK